jgi:threonine aldolase
LFNALVARGELPQQYGPMCDTISICFSKGLGAPAGSLLLGSKAIIQKAHRYRKAMGGGMRQAGYLAAAGLYALEHNVKRLQEDHQKAKYLEAELQRLPYISAVMPVETNIVIFRLDDAVGADEFLQKLQRRDILAVSIAKQTIRFVFHLNVTDGQVNELVESLRAIR